MEAEARSERLWRTWLQVLIDTNHREIAALLVDGQISEQWYNFSPSVSIDLPSSAYLLVQRDTRIQEVIQKSLNFVARGHITDQNGNDLDSIPLTYRMKLLDVEEDWRNVVRELITNAKDPNQAVVTEKAFRRRGKQPYLYNEMKFASQSEIRIAQELERRGVLFFPLPLAVRGDTGDLFQDHRELDFLVCEKGVWGVIEVSYHPNRFEQDAEKDLWFKESGLLCVQHYTAERCFESPGQVVDEFLSVLRQHRR